MSGVTENALGNLSMILWPIVFVFNIQVVRVGTCLSFSKVVTV